jgi:hypothetical protein
MAVPSGCTALTQRYTTAEGPLAGCSVSPRRWYRTVNVARENGLFVPTLKDVAKLPAGLVMATGFGIIAAGQILMLLLLRAADTATPLTSCWIPAIRDGFL